jgi:hypothetical protein
LDHPALPKDALPQGAHVVFREGRVEHLGTVLETLANGLVRVGIGSDGDGGWVCKIVPMNMVQIL